MLETLMKLHLLFYGMAAMGAVGIAGMLTTNLTYRRMIRNTEKVRNLKEKWLNLWKSRDKLLQRMNRFVWYPSLVSTVLMGTALFLATKRELNEGLPLRYLYLGAAVPMGLLLLRQTLDFSYRQDLVANSLADYVEQAKCYVEEIPVNQRKDPLLQEEVVEKITASIRQTAAAGSHFSKMLTPEEEEIMRDIIKEFMG